MRRACERSNPTAAAAINDKSLATTGRGLLGVNLIAIATAGAGSDSPASSTGGTSTEPAVSEFNAASPARSTRYLRCFAFESGPGCSCSSCCLGTEERCRAGRPLKMCCFAGASIE